MPINPSVNTYQFNTSFLPKLGLLLLNLLKDDSKNPLAICIHVSLCLRNVVQILSNSRWGTAALPLGLFLSQHTHTQSSHGYQHCFWPVIIPVLSTAPRDWEQRLRAEGFRIPGQMSSIFTLPSLLEDKEV